MSMALGFGPRVGQGGGPGLLPDGFAFRDVLGRVPCAWLSSRSRRRALLWGVPGAERSSVALGKPGGSSSPRAEAGNCTSSPGRPLPPGQQVPAGPSHRNAGAQAVQMPRWLAPARVPHSFKNIL